jgi:DNA-binding HxlR family transcriptional regulator
MRRTIQKSIEGAGIHNASRTVRELSNSDTLLIVRELNQGVRSRADLAAVLRTKQHIISERLTQLEEAEIVERQSTGKRTTFKLSSTISGQFAAAVCKILLS